MVREDEVQRENEKVVSASVEENCSDAPKFISEFYVRSYAYHC